jgi:hypothetical protein
VWEDTGSTDAAENGDPIERWSDQSGNGHHGFGDGSDGGRPQYLTGEQNGLPVVRSYWTGSATRFPRAPDHADLELVGDITVVMVVKVISNASPLRLVEKGAGPLHYYLDGTGKPVADRSAVEVGVAGTTSLGTSAYRVATLHISGTAVTHYLDGAANGTDTLTSAGTANSQSISLGLHTGETRVGEMLIYNVALSAGDTDAAEDYLGTRWGITITH